MSVIVKAFVSYQHHVQQNGVAGTKLGQHVAVHFVKVLVPNPTKVTWLAVHVKPDASAYQDTSETKRGTVSHGANVLHKILAVKMNTIHGVEVHVKKQSVLVFNHMDTIAILKEIIRNVLLPVKKDVNVFLDTFVMMLLTVTVSVNVLLSINVSPIQSLQRMHHQLQLRQHQPMED